MKRDELLQPGFAPCPLSVLRRRDLSPTAKLIYGALAKHLNNGTEWVWPGIATLADMTGSGRSTVIEAIAALKAAGLIFAGGKHRRSVSYSLTLPSAEQSRTGTSPESGLVQNPDQSRIRTPNSPESGPELSKGTKTDSPHSPPPVLPAATETAETSDAASGHPSPVPPSETSFLPGAAVNPQSRRAPARRAASLDARQLAEQYRRLVLPGDRTCSPGGRAVRNVEALLRSSEATAQQLAGCVANYAAAMEAEERPPGYRKAGGNFFGSDGTWREWMDPLTAAEIERKRTDATTRKNAGGTARTGPGRGGFIPPGDFAGRDDAVLA